MASIITIFIDYISHEDMVNSLRNLADKLENDTNTNQVQITSNRGLYLEMEIYDKEEQVLVSHN